MSKLHASCFSPNGMSRFCLLFGKDISRSLSPAMHSKWFREHSLNAIYLPCPLESSEDFQMTIRALTNIKSFLGGNITAPFKQIAVENAGFLKVTETVQCIRAANTLYKSSEGHWSLANTDVKGIQASFDALLPTSEREIEVIVLGGGGAAAAVFYCASLLPSCRTIRCITRHPELTRSRFPWLCEIKNLEIWPLSPQSFQATLSDTQSQQSPFRLLINTIPAYAVHDEEGVAEKWVEILTAGRGAYFDLIYEDTRAMKLARSRGIRALDGRLMLKVQAAESFFLWTGVHVALDDD